MPPCVALGIFENVINLYAFKKELMTVTVDRSVIHATPVYTNVYQSLALYISGYPRHRENRENRENGQKIPCQGKRREFGNFAKTQGILFAQLVNSLILKVKDTAIFATKISIFAPEVG